MRKRPCLRFTLVCALLVLNFSPAFAGERTEKKFNMPFWASAELLFNSIYYKWKPHVPATYSVTPDGKESLSRVVFKLRAGDTLLLGEGVYKDSCDFISSGRPDAFITVEGSGHAVIDGSGRDYYDPAFDTHGHSYLFFKNIEVLHSRAGVQINRGSHHIRIEGLKTDRTQFAVKMDNASFITIRGVDTQNNRSGIRATGKTHDVLIENASSLHAKDDYPGYHPKYLNGDSFVFEKPCANITIRNAVGGDNWDSGFDIKADHVRLENIISYGNKNGLKFWGKDIVATNVLVTGSKKQRLPKGGVDGMGVNVRRGDARIVHATFVDNEAEDVKIGKKGTLVLENSIVARKSEKGKLLGRYGHFSQDRVLWYQKGTAEDEVSVPENSLWADPQFENWEEKNFHLKASSPAVDRGRAYEGIPDFDLDKNKRLVGAQPDLGAYEFQENKK